ncbi:PRC and DUF2382 domain-containing protein [Arthrobacter sp. I3]|uniref:PRC and DUF2382 domain-containing protein n=1 Tax=Arthrobacter sp. I3 TaxID=218158 RepID=UPI000486DFB6|nr:PRC and DUF2382 domain-containing protein [Arthrobacter sp. I3]
MLTTEQIDRLLSQGANVLSGDGEKIGSIGQVFVDNEAGQPSWVTVRTGLFGMSESFVPLEGARLEGNDIVVPYNKNQVKDAPRIDADRPLEPAEEDRLYQHYRMDSGRTYTDADTADAASATRQDASGTERAETRDATGTAGYGTATPTTDAATPPTTRQDTTGTDRAQTRDATDTNRAETRDATGRGRLRKYVTTETVTRTVPVQREEVRIEREPIAEEDRDEVSNRPASDDEVILHEERVIVTKETVPVERVRIVTETVADEVTIREKVHKEHFDGESSEGSEGSEGTDASRG